MLSHFFHSFSLFLPFSDIQEADPLQAKPEKAMVPIYPTDHWCAVSGLRLKPLYYIINLV